MVSCSRNTWLIHSIIKKVCTSRNFFRLGSTFLEGEMARVHMKNLLKVHSRLDWIDIPNDYLMFSLIFLCLKRRFIKNILCKILTVCSVHFFWKTLFVLCTRTLTNGEGKHWQDRTCFKIEKKNPWRSQKQWSF